LYFACLPQADTLYDVILLLASFLMSNAERRTPIEEVDF
jgi:hypothetical protein